MAPDQPHRRIEAALTRLAQAETRLAQAELRLRRAQQAAVESKALLRRSASPVGQPEQRYGRPSEDNSETYAEAQAFLADSARLSEAEQRARKEAIIDAFRAFWSHVKAPSHEAAMREFARTMDGVVMFPEVLSIMATKADAGRSWGGSVN
jgi:hypothetical protein